MNLFTYIKDRITIVEVISEYLSLKKAGIYYKGSCPFHQERDASFTVSPHKGIFYCFGCHATGDVISFLSQMEGCNQFEAAKLLIEKYSLDVPAELLQEKKDSTQTLDEKNHYFALCELMSSWCHKQIKNSLDAQQYLSQRNISPAIVDQFKVGYFPSGLKYIKSFQKYAHEEGFLIKDLTVAHLLNEGNHHFYSPFEDRIIFPITDHLGRNCGFGGRIFKENDERAKYYNSQESALFNKGALLFGLSQAKKAIQKTKQAFLVEGYTDCIAMVQYGYPNTIATLGTACTHQHLKQISHYADELFVLFDGDSAGLKAVLRLTQLCWDVNIDIRVIQLPKNEDPASFLGAGENLKTCIKKAEDIFSFFMHTSTQEFKTQPLKKKLAIVRELMRIINTINDDLKKMILLQDAATKLNLPIETLKNECRKQYEPEKPSISPEAVTIKISDSEKRMFVVLLEMPDLLQKEIIKIMYQAFSEPLKTIIQIYDETEEKTIPSLLEKLSEEYQQLTQQLLVTHDKEQNDYEKIIKEFAKRNWKKIALNTKEQIALAQKKDDLPQVKVLLQQLQELKKKVLNWSAQ
jgi:DNA primase